MDAGPDGGLDGGRFQDAGQSWDAGQCLSGPASDLGVITYFAAPGFYSAASGDLNGDGQLDLVGGGLYSDVGVQLLFGEPDGGLGSPFVLEQGVSGATSIAVGDLDGDGIPDIAAVGDAFMVFLNDGSGGFTLTTHQQPQGRGLYLDLVQIGDFNGDGASDLFVSGGTPGDFGSAVIEVLVNQGSGVFADPVVIPGLSGSRAPPENGEPAGFLVADLNGDGLADIVANTADGMGLAVLLGLGDGGFTVASYPFPLVGGISLLPNPKGAPDLIADVTEGLYTPTGVFVLKNSGSGAFALGSQLSEGTGARVVVGDFNGDCVPDVAIFSSGLNCEGLGSTVISVSFGQSDGGLLAPQSLAAGDPTQFAMALMGPKSDPRALAFVTSCVGFVTVYGDASR